MKSYGPKKFLLGAINILTSILRQAHALTGKPSVLVAHSLGNFGSLYTLNSMSSEEKKKYIANFVSMMNPLSGSPKTVLTYMGGNSEYFRDFHGLNIGVKQAHLKMLLEGSSGFFDVLPKSPAKQFKVFPSICA